VPRRIRSPRRLPSDRNLDARGKGRETASSLALQSNSSKENTAERVEWNPELERDEPETSRGHGRARDAPTRATWPLPPTPVEEVREEGRLDSYGGVGDGDGGGRM
jgi:hypothetical protein